MGTISRALASALVFGGALALAGRGTALHDPTLPLVILVAWWARLRGREAGAASAAGAVLVVLAALAAAGGPAGPLVARLLVAVAALGATAWLVAPAAPIAGAAATVTEDPQSFRALAETLPQIVWMSAPDGQLEYLNERGLAYTGLPLADALRGGFRAAVHRDDLSECIDRWRHALGTGEPFEMQYRIRQAADGQARWHLGRALPVRGGDGGITRWFGTCTDIHEQRQHTGASRRWELLFNHSSWGVLLLDAAANTISAANPAFERMHGRADGSMQGLPLADVLAPDARAQLEACLERVARDGRAVFESAHVRQDGTRFPVLVDVTDIRHPDGSCDRMANYLDLTLIRAADAARETAEVRFRAVQDASPDSFTLWDVESGPDGLDGVLRYANPAASRLMRRDLHEDLGRRMSELFPGFRQSPRYALYERVYRTGRTEEATAYAEEVGAWLRLVSVKIADGIGVIATDVSASKQAEEVMRRTQDELEELVTERTRELHHARDLAVQANRAKSDFLSRASHELRTPLSSVIGFSNILLKNKQGSLAPDEITYLSRIARNGRNLLALVNDLLDLSKIEAGRVDLELSPVSLFDVLHEVQDTLEPRAAELGLALRVEVEQENDLIIADETRLRQVLVNLAGNAIKYTRRAGVVLRVVSNDAGAPVRIDVVDSGAGIPPERLDAIFQPFIVDATPAAGDAATGLGLAITRALCDLMGYRLTLESRVGHGSTFSVHLLPNDFTLRS
jgi:PAS domain S-box-containing protein